MIFYTIFIILHFCIILSDFESGHPAKSNLHACLSSTPHCAEIDAYISSFMDSYFLWNEFINSEKRFNEEIIRKDQTFPVNIIPEIYKYVKNDLLIEYKRRYFYLAYEYLQYNNEIYNRYTSHYLYILKKYQDDSDVNTPIFKYQSNFRNNFQITKEMKELISDKSLLFSHKFTNFSTILLNRIVTGFTKIEEETKEIILKIVELLPINEIDEINNINDFIKYLHPKIYFPINQTEKIYPYISDILNKQKNIINEMGEFFEIYENANYAQSRYFIENFIDAFSLKETPLFKTWDLYVLFYNKFKIRFQKKLERLEKLFANYEKNYNRIKLKEEIVKYLRKNTNPDLKFPPKMYILVEIYEINLGVQNYGDFLNIFKNKDLEVEELDIFLIYKYYLNFIEFLNRNRALNGLFEKINPEIKPNFAQIYPYLEEIYDFYKLNEQDIQINHFMNKIYKLDFAINEMVIRKIHPYIIKYILFKKRNKAQMHLISNIENYLDLTCHFKASDFTDIAKLYEIFDLNDIKILQNTDPDSLKNHILKMDENMIPLKNVEYIVKYLRTCDIYTRQKRKIDRLNIFIDENPREYYYLSYSFEEFLEVTKLTPHDVKNFNNFKEKMLKIYKVYSDTKLYKIYNYVLYRMKYNKRNYIKNQFAGFYRNFEKNTIFKISKIDNLISNYGIEMKQLKNPEDLLFVFENMDGSINKGQTKSIFKTLIKYKNFSNRAKILKNIITHVTKNSGGNINQISFYINQIVSEYRSLENEINSKQKFVNFLKKHYGIIDFPNVNLLHKTILKYLNSYFILNKNSYIKDTKFSFVSKNIKTFIDLHKIKLSDVSSIKEFIMNKKFDNLDSIHSEKSYLYINILKYFQNRKKNKSFKMILTLLKNKESVNYLKISPQLEYLTRHYNLNEINFYHIFQLFYLVDKTDGYYVETDIASVFRLFKYYIHSRIITKYKAEFINSENDESIKILLHEKYLNRFMEITVLKENNITNFVELKRFLENRGIFSIEKDVSLIYSAILNHMKIYKRYQ